MAVTSIPKRNAVALKVDAGTAGSPKILSVSLGKIKQGANAEAIMDVADLLAACLEHPTVSVERTNVDVLERV